MPCRTSRISRGSARVPRRMARRAAGFDEAIRGNRRVFSMVMRGRHGDEPSGPTFSPSMVTAASWGDLSPRWSLTAHSMILRGERLRPKRRSSFVEGAQVPAEAA